MSTSQNELEAHLDALLSLPDMWNSLPAPDAQRVAWTWGGISPTADVYMAATDGTKPPVRLTDTDQNTWLVSWAPDSQSVVVAQDQNGDERVQLFRVMCDQPGILNPLTEPRPDYYIYGGELHPNGRWLIYGANVDETGQEIEPMVIYRHDLQSGQRQAVTRTEQASGWPPQLNTQGTHILYVRKDLHPAGMQLWLVDIDGQHDREIVNLGADAKVRGVWCPDGRHILIHADAPSHFRVGLWSLDTGDLRWLIDDPTRNIEEINFPPASHQAVLLESHFARYRARLLDVNTSTETPWPDTPGQTSLPVTPAPGGGWVVCQYSSTQLRDLVHHADDGTSSSLSRVWDQTSLRADDLIAAEDMRWYGDDGLEIQGWLYRARGESRGTIIYVHGGPTWHYEDWVDSEIQFLAWCGFNVLAPNYRGSTGFGKAYREAIKKEGWGAEEQADIRAGIEALIEAGIAHPGRIGITGTSYGGYSSWCAITRQPVELVAAAAPICGMTDLVIDYKTTRPDLRPYSAEMLGGTPDDVPERYHQRSPVHYVEAIRGRLLIVQGEQDPNVTPENVRVVRDRLDASGTDYEVLTFADEGHGIARRANRKTLLLRLNTFFTQAFERID